MTLKHVNDINRAHNSFVTRRVASGSLAAGALTRVWQTPDALEGMIKVFRVA